MYRLIGQNCCDSGIWGFWVHEILFQIYRHQTQRSSSFSSLIFSRHFHSSTWNFELSDRDYVFFLKLIDGVAMRDFFDIWCIQLYSGNGGTGCLRSVRLAPHSHDSNTILTAADFRFDLEHFFEDDQNLTSLKNSYSSICSKFSLMEKKFSYLTFVK